MDNEGNKQISFKQDLINHLIWLLIINGVFAYFGKQMEKGTIGTVGQIIWFISALLLFGFLFAFTKVLKRKYNVIFSFVLSLILIFAVNFILLAIIP